MSAHVTKRIKANKQPRDLLVFGISQQRICSANKNNYFLYRALKLHHFFRALVYHVLHRMHFRDPILHPGAHFGYLLSV